MRVRAGSICTPPHSEQAQSGSTYLASSGEERTLSKAATVDAASRRIASDPASTLPFGIRSLNTQISENHGEMVEAARIEPASVIGESLLTS